MERQSHYRRYIRLCVTACGGHGSLHGCDAALARNLDAHTHRIARRRNDRSLRALLKQELCLLRCVWNAAFSSVCTRVIDVVMRVMLYSSEITRRNNIALNVTDFGLLRMFLASENPKPRVALKMYSKPA